MAELLLDAAGRRRRRCRGSTPGARRTTRDTATGPIRPPSTEIVAVMRAAGDARSPTRAAYRPADSASSATLRAAGPGQPRPPAPKGRHGRRATALCATGYVMPTTSRPPRKGDRSPSSSAARHRDLGITSICFNASPTPRSSGAVHAPRGQGAGQRDAAPLIAARERARRAWRRIVASKLGHRAAGP
jgi:hypothetical protein